MKEKKVVIIITAIISVLVIAIAITSVFLLSPSAQYTRSIQEAENLVEEGDYENAILAYQEAIEKDPENVEAYLGLAELYEKSGEMSLAIQTLETGYKRTKSAQIKVMLNKFVETGGDSGMVSSTTLAFNQELLNMFSTYREEDYEETYGRSDGRRDARFEGLDAEIRFDEDGVPTEIHLDDILTLFNRVEPIPVEELEDMSLNSYRTTSSVSHGEMVVFEHEGTEVTIAVEDGQVTSDSYNSIVPLSIEKEVEDEETEVEKSPTVLVTGRTVDEESNAAIASVTISVYQGTQPAGTVVTTTTSDGNGYFSLTLERSGDFYLVLDKDIYHGETSISVTEESADEENIGMVYLQKADYEIQAILEYTKGDITLEAALGMDGADPTHGTAGGNVLHHPTTGEVTAIREVTESGNQVRDVITIFNRNLPWLYTVIRRSGTAPIASANTRVTIRDRGKDDIVMTPADGNSSAVWQPFIAWRGVIQYVDLFN